MINALINGIFNLVIGLVSVILAPIDALIDQFLPSVSDLLGLFNQFLGYISDSFLWALSWTGLNSTVRGAIVAYFTFILTVPILVHTIKLAIAWYNKLKP